MTRQICPTGSVQCGIPDMSDIWDALDAEYCIGAATTVGVPESVIAYLNKPVSERNFVEKAAIETAVAAVNLPAGCADSLVGQ